ncbi:MAG TPA: hypothetical protein DCZ10_16185 [Pelotomaculum sp.]|jgi:hypothetical protein|nr:hypothetical protein [Pelotomaculum sp.]
MRVCIQKSTGILRGSCSSSLPETLITQAIQDYGIPEIDLEVREVTVAQYKALLDVLPKPQLMPLEQLSATDKGMARVAEDLIDLLLLKGTITETDLPEVVRQKLAERKQLRSWLASR